MHRRTAVTSLLVALTLLAGACGAADDASMEGSSADDSSSGWDERAGDPRGGDDAGIYVESAGDGLTAAPEAGPGGLRPDAPEPPAGAADLAVEPTAGSVDDNELWDEYLRYRDEFFAKGVPISDIPVAGRQLLTVVDADGDPVLGATITVTDGDGAEVVRLRSYADGRAVFLAGTEVDPNDQSRPTYTAQVDARGGAAGTFTLEPGALEQTLTLDADVPSPAQVDVLFLIDATGSMGDEIERLKASMISVAEEIGSLPSAPDTRLAAVTYRDRGDDYVTRRFDFTGDVAGFTEALAEVEADGGGDTPEALGSGLAEAVEGVSWRGDDTVKLIFLVADAAPHLAGEEGYEDEPDYATVARAAATAGIKVFPIASSGLDVQGEFAFRQLAQVTMGRFVFLTYGPDGASPGDQTPHDVDPEDYDVLPLDGLIVQLVGDELDGLPR